MDKGNDQFFANAALLTSRFGAWPSFHDAEILRVELSRSTGVALRLAVYVFATSPQLDSRGCYKRIKESVVTLTFRGTDEMTLLDFNEQNVLRELLISRQENGRFRVEILSSYGLNGGFLCNSAEVAHVENWGLAEG